MFGLELLQHDARYDYLDEWVEVLNKLWAATEEFSSSYSNWPPGSVEQVLHELAALCKQAVIEHKAVLMWMC